jgi:hypothetical protein
MAQTQEIPILVPRSLNPCPDQIPVLFITWHCKLRSGFLNNSSTLKTTSIARLTNLHRNLERWRSRYRDVSSGQLIRWIRSPFSRQEQTFSLMPVNDGLPIQRHPIILDLIMRKFRCERDFYLEQKKTEMVGLVSMGQKVMAKDSGREAMRIVVKLRVS